MKNCNHELLKYHKDAAINSLNDFDFRGYLIDYSTIQIYCENCNEWF